MSSTKFVFFGPIGKTRWPPWPLIGWDIFDFFSETAERNSTKLDRRQDLNVLYEGRTEKQEGRLASDCLRQFNSLLLWNRWTEFNETWQEARCQRPLPSLCFRADRKNKMAVLASDWLRHFQLIIWNRNSTKLDRKQDLNVLYQVIRADQKKNVAPVSHWLRHFELFLLNGWRN